jgi:hypothetical protein
MTGQPIRSREEAREQLKRLENFYGVPILPLSTFCDGMDTWMDCIIKNNTDPELTQGSIRHGHNYFEVLQKKRKDIRKSNLLGRLSYARETLRTRMCPVHKGHYSGEARFFQKCPHLCDDTGWLRENPGDGGYTGEINIYQLAGDKIVKKFSE